MGYLSMFIGAFINHFIIVKIFLNAPYRYEVGEYLLYWILFWIPTTLVIACIIGLIQGYVERENYVKSIEREDRQYQNYLDKRESQWNQIYSDYPELNEQWMCHPNDEVRSGINFDKKLLYFVHSSGSLIKVKFVDLINFSYEDSQDRQGFKVVIINYFESPNIPSSLWLDSSDLGGLTTFIGFLEKAITLKDNDETTVGKRQQEPINEAIQ
jgi:hypothetical protein